MSKVLKSQFLRQFAGGFVLGALALVAVQPGTVVHNLGLDRATIAQAL